MVKEELSVNAGSCDSRDKKKIVCVHARVYEREIFRN